MTSKQSVQFEVERKALLANAVAAQNLFQTMQSLDKDLQHLGHITQRNHYYTGGSYEDLLRNVPGLDAKDKSAIHEILQASANVGLRTRENDGKDSILILKGSKSNISAAHATSRFEFEKELAIPQPKLDELVSASHFIIQAKWYAERDKYKFQDVIVEIMFTPGYGYMAEVECMASDEQERQVAEQRVNRVMETLRLEPVLVERLERMFAYYNEHWPEYYDTRKTFTIE